MAHKIGERMQPIVLPNIIDDYVGPHDPVRAYDAFVNALDFTELGISLKPTKGADEYYPKDMVKLLVWGYSYGIRSSRKLERACHHNLSFIWLMGGLKPDYRTISRFRRDHKKALANILKQCVRLCIKLGLIEGNSLFTDGSGFRADASIKHTWTQERCEKHLADIDQHIEQLLEDMEHIDATEEETASLAQLKDDLKDKEQLKQNINEIVKTLQQKAVTDNCDVTKVSHNTVDSDCVKIKSRQGTHAGYNVQMTVDGEHGLIVCSQATVKSSDANQFSAQVAMASEVLKDSPQTVCADSGYHSLKDLEKVPPAIAIVMPSQNQVQEEHGHPLSAFHKERFGYDQQQDEYICPEGKRLSCVGTISSGRSQGSRQYQARSQDCQNCRHFGVCTQSSRGRMILRLKDEELQQKLQRIYTSPLGQAIYKLRQQKVELPFGHLKRNLGAGQFLLRGQPGANAEISILSTCFNIARMITLVGMDQLIFRLNGT